MNLENPESKTAESVRPEPNRDFGTVSAVEGDQLLTTGDSGEKHVHTVQSDANVTGRGKDCDVSDLAVGSRVRITEGADDPAQATAVESVRKPGSASD